MKTTLIFFAVLYIAAALPYEDQMALAKEETINLISMNGFVKPAMPATNQSMPTLSKKKQLTSNALSVFTLHLLSLPSDTQTPPLMFGKIFFIHYK